MMGCTSIHAVHAVPTVISALGSETKRCIGQQYLFERSGRIRTEVAQIDLPDFSIHASSLEISQSNKLRLLTAPTASPSQT